MIINKDSRMNICYRCGGSKKYMGNGMLMMSCYNCDDQGYEKPKELEPFPDMVNSKIQALDRRSTSYKKAIQEIMDLNPMLTRNEAVKIFDKEYDK